MYEIILHFHYWTVRDDGHVATPYPTRLLPGHGHTFCHKIYLLNKITF